MLAGAAGFEPANAGTKNRGLTTWRRPSRLAAYCGEAAHKPADRGKGSRSATGRLPIVSRARAFSLRANVRRFIAGGGPVMKTAALLAVATALTATASIAQTPASAPLYPPFGLDLTAADKSTRPGDDFFQYANGS